MSVDLIRLLQTMGGSLMAGSTLTLREDYQQKTGLVLGVLLMIASEESDRLVDRLVEENAALRDLFASARNVVEDRLLAERLGEAAAGEDASLRVSSLQPENHRLRALLVDLHARVEEDPSEEARALEDSIWAELARSSQRRTLVLAPL
jgi:hypothetical protein